MVKLLPIKEWDTRVAPALRDIEESAEWIAYLAKKIKARVKTLEYMPIWTSRAEDSIQRAKDELAKIQSQLQDSLSDLRQKEKVE